MAEVAAGLAGARIQLGCGASGLGLPEEGCAAGEADGSCGGTGVCGCAALNQKKNIYRN